MKYFNKAMQGFLPLVLLLVFSISLHAQQAHIARSAKKDQMKQTKQAKATTEPQDIKVEMIIKSQPNTTATPLKQALLDKYGNDESAIVAARKVIKNYEKQGFTVVVQKEYTALEKKAENQDSTPTLQLEKFKVLEKILPN